MVLISSKFLVYIPFLILHYTCSDRVVFTVCCCFLFVLLIHVFVCFSPTHSPYFIAFSSCLLISRSLLLVGLVGIIIICFFFYILSLLCFVSLVSLFLPFFFFCCLLVGCFACILLFCVIFNLHFLHFVCFALILLCNNIFFFLWVSFFVCLFISL